MRFLGIVFIGLIAYWLIASSASITAFPIWAANNPHGAMVAIQNVGHALYDGIGPFAQRYLTGAIGIGFGYAFARIVDFGKWIFHAPAGAR